ncbi:MAG: DNA double-strand break repair nuclease NurA [Chloroflexota bacterium]
MTLDLLRVGPQVRRMGATLRTRAGWYEQRVWLARRTLSDQAGNWQHLAELARTARGRRLATPLERLDATYPLPPIPSAFRVIATDGSQIEPDRHGVADFYLINIGKVVIDYGVRPAAALSSEPTLYFDREDLYIQHGDRRITVTDHHLSAKRSQLELQAAGTLAADPGEEPRPTVVLADGTLLMILPEDRPEDIFRENLLRPYVREMGRLGQAGVPLASYVSRPRATEVSALLREATCKGLVERCDTCFGSGEGVCGLDALPDRELFRALAPGERSALFSMTLSSPLLDYYQPEGIDQVPRFFYVNVGSEIARVELSAWVAADSARIDLVHSVIVDQCRRGQGYPVTIARAHEQAVVTGQDRAAFRRMLEETLVREGVPGRTSEKQLSKDRKAV